MRLITLNIWGAQLYKPFIAFIKEQEKTTDIFCFQEVFNGRPSPLPIFKDAVVDIYSQLETILSTFQGYFARAEDIGLAIFVRKTIEVEKEGDIFVYRWRDAMEHNNARTMGRNMQYVQFSYKKKNYAVANLHGLWNGAGKTDTPDRIEQSKKVKTFLDSMKGAKILCGDFNLLPDTKSIEILEKGMRNLVKEHGVTSTRSHYYTRSDKYADYILISPEIKVSDFKVLQDIISDHLPLQLEFT